MEAIFETKLAIKVMGRREPTPDEVMVALREKLGIAANVETRSGEDPVLKGNGWQCTDISGMTRSILGGSSAAPKVSP